MESIGSITIVAPEQEQSAKSHSITLNDLIEISNLEKRVMLSVKGTPVDCAKLHLKVS